MDDTGQVGTVLPLNKGLLRAAAALVAVGGTLAAAGLGLGGFILASALRKWSQSLPTPPRELARQRLSQAKVARTAAVDAWRTKPGAADDVVDTI